MMEYAYLEDEAMPECESEGFGRRPLKLGDVIAEDWQTLPSRVEARNYWEVLEVAKTVPLRPHEEVRAFEFGFWVGPKSRGVD